MPGQGSSPRFQSLEEVFSQKDPAHGIIHVVANGFIKLRSEDAQKVLAEGGVDTIAKYRDHQKSAELRDLDETCSEIRKSIARSRQPAWLIVAVTKTDLYINEIEAARRYYSPHGDSEFAARLKTLQNQVGSDNFRWASLPVCAWLEDFTWNGELAESTLKPNQRDHYLSNFAQHLESYCE